MLFSAILVMGLCLIFFCWVKRASLDLCCFAAPQKPRLWHESSLSDYCLVQFKNYYSPCDFCNNHKLISQCIIQRVNFQVLKHTRFLLQSLIVPQHRYIPWADTKVKGRGCSAVAIAFHLASSSPPASGQDPFSGDTADRDTWTSWQMAVKIYLGFPL